MYTQMSAWSQVRTWNINCSVYTLIRKTLPLAWPCLHPSTCYLSSCCRADFMDFTCWKWQDMSVANTISITKARSSLSGQTEKRPVLSALSRTKGYGEKKAGIRVSGMPHAVLCSHKLVLREIDKNVHLIVLHHSKNRADVVILQHRAIVVQDGTFRPVKLYVMPRPL